MEAWTLELVLSMPSVPYPLRRTLPDVPGLYFAVQDEAEIIYIGMASKSLRRRWQVWHKAACLIRRYDLSNQIAIAYEEVIDPSILHDVERAAIGAFCPRFNFNHVPGALERERQRYEQNRPRKQPPV